MKDNFPLLSYRTASYLSKLQNFGMNVVDLWSRLPYFSWIFWKIKRRWYPSKILNTTYLSVNLWNLRISSDEGRVHNRCWVNRMIQPKGVTDLMHSCVEKVVFVPRAKKELRVEVNRSCCGKKRVSQNSRSQFCRTRFPPVWMDASSKYNLNVCIVVFGFDEIQIGHRTPLIESILQKLPHGTRGNIHGEVSYIVC